MVAKTHTKTQDFESRKGDTWEHTFLVISKTDGNPVDFLAGATARMVFHDGASVVLELTEANNRISITPASGQVDALITNTESEVVWTTANYELEVTYGDGRVKTHFAGTFTMTDDLD